MKRVCVFCGSAMGTRPEFEGWALSIGSWIAENGFGLVYGGASVGLMGVLANACLTQGGQVTGVIPKHLAKEEIVHPGLQNLLEVDNMFDRKSIMLKYSDLFVVLPGGFGTLDELFEVVTLAQLKQHDKPVILFNGEGFFDPLLMQLNQMVVSGFIKEKYLALLHIAKDLQSLFALIRKHSGPQS
ncbi:MAG: Rossman fold protein, TIGR00730 family [Candidatus Lambdaproteobacteria bacterium RIFOXYD2_FULL_50_16]|uniref:Cytokinin riboside 5'-monophosphate phosphoribohydrolase n=1 Tax=Candidatus Lambdaproteobacteria bacterium RIFOXYD2_FULL_50_16 TaxID=1817772 RepID=A0A1F6GAV3_9PROT|nr:MAG: Rossman fold protein, TIGR00730 family [Candidatus Lambdaproteobacteria bacterium RIFOXYD2_FULL_50_16]